MSTDRYSLPRLRDLPKEVRMLAFLIMMGLGVGYAHAIGYVYLTTHIVPSGVAERYRGTEPVQPASNTPPATSESTGIGSPEDTPSETTTSTKSEAAKPEATQTEPAKEIQYAKSLGEMLNVIHTHVITMTLIFAVSGFITLLTGSLPTRLRSFAVTEPFFGIIATFAGIWATRYLGAGWSWLASISGSLMALAFAVQCVAVLLELRTKSVASSSRS